MNQNLNLTLADILGDYLTGVGVLTDGRSFRVDEATGVCCSGWWTCNADRIRQLKGVAVCERPEGGVSPATIHVGTIIDVKTNDENLVEITFQRERMIKVDEFSWPDFAATGSNPIRYVPYAASENQDV